MNRADIDGTDIDWSHAYRPDVHRPDADGLGGRRDAGCSAARSLAALGSFHSLALVRRLNAAELSKRSRSALLNSKSVIAPRASLGAWFPSRTAAPISAPRTTRL